MKIINLIDQASHDSGNVPFKKTKKYADYASSATLIKSAKIMLVFPNYAKNYASTIDKGLVQLYPLIHVETELCPEEFFF